MKINKNLVFLHIPKNGGNTIHSILDRIYDKKNTFSIKVINNTKLNTSNFINLPVKERAEIKLLKGHMLFGLHTYLEGDSSYFTFLRKPEDRLLSFYHYVKKKPNHRLYKEIFDNDLSFHEFIEQINAGDIHNAQVRWISGLEHGTEKEMFDTAISNIDKHFKLVGLLEQFDISLLMLSQTYNWGTPYYKTQNKGNYKKTNETIEQRTLNLIRKKNAADIKLYSLIEKEFLLKKNEIKFLRLKLIILKYKSKFYSSYKVNKLKKLFN